MANHGVVNEAEFQARLESRIRKAFPLLPAQIKLEHYLHLRLGHHRIVIDGTDSDKGGTSGRYDILVLTEGKPLLIAELKAPGIGIGRFLGSDQAIWLNLRSNSPKRRHF